MRGALHDEPGGAYDALLSLCAGAEPALTPEQWPSVLSAAMRERCVALAWWRSADAIRRQAPADVVTAWRAAALAAMDHGQRQVALAHCAVTELRMAGIDVCVGRGVALSARLYGHPGLRVSTDVDLFVPSQQHARARDVIVAMGGDPAENFPPFQTSYRLSAAFAGLNIEIHSWLLDDTLLTGLRVPIGRAESMPVGDGELPGLRWGIMPAFLAADMACDGPHTLLQDIDFHTLWRGLSPSEQRAAVGEAAAHGLGAYLRWAVARAALLESALMRNGAALAELLSRRPEHQMRALLRRTDSIRVAGRIVTEWLAPEQARGSARALARVWRHRLAQGARLATGRYRRRGSPIATDRVATLELVRAAVGQGGSVWLRARGLSMEPAIPNGALLRLEPIVAGPHPGDVVLAELPAGGLVIHRVARADAQTVVTRGDNLHRDDCPTTPDRVVARVAAIEGGLAATLSEGAAAARRRVRRLRRSLTVWARPS